MFIGKCSRSQVSFYRTIGPLVNNFDQNIDFGYSFTVNVPTIYVEGLLSNIGGKLWEICSYFAKTLIEIGNMIGKSRQFCLNKRFSLMIFRSQNMSVQVWIKNKKKMYIPANPCFSM